MSDNIRSIVKELTPPIVLNQLSGFFYGWKGNYSTWEEARKKCSGYDNEVILSKVKEAMLKVKKGEAVFERDSVLFDKIHYSFPLLSGLTIAAINNHLRLNILDFGGSLGSSYFQNKNILSGLQELNWCIVEQPHFVKEGAKTFEDEHLHFFYDINSCMDKLKIDVFLLASVLPYLEKPYELLDQIIEKKIEYLLIDRTQVLSKGKDRIAIQTVPKNIYSASYPCWFLNEEKLIHYLSKHYELIFDSTSPERVNIRHSSLKCFFFKRKK
jgi:putative methyltransferase (TIGR04325 family)